MASTPATPGATPRWLTDEQQRSWRGFVAGSRRLMARLDADLKVAGLNHDDYGVLVSLSEAPEGRLRMAELAESTVESRSRLSHHIGRMERQGLVVRKACSEDKRGFFAELTPHGRATLEAIAPHHVEGVRRWMVDVLSPEQLQHVGEAFSLIDEALLADGCSANLCDEDA